MRSDDRPTGRQPTFTEHARRAQIVACAIEVLAETGYAQTSFARVAERANISKSVISYHFGSKDELLEEVVRSVYADGARYMLPRIEAAQTEAAQTEAAQTETQGLARAMLAAYLRSNLEYIRDHGQAIAAVAEIAVNARARDGSLRFAGSFGDIEAMLKPLQDILLRGQADGDLAAFQTRTMAWAIRSLIDGVNRQRRLDPQFDFETAIDELTALVDRATRKGGT